MHFQIDWMRLQPWNSYNPLVLKPYAHISTHILFSRHCSFWRHRQNGNQHTYGFMTQVLHECIHNHVSYTTYKSTPAAPLMSVDYMPEICFITTHRHNFTHTTCCTYIDNLSYVWTAYAAFDLSVFVAQTDSATKYPSKL